MSEQRSAKPPVTVMTVTDTPVPHPRPVQHDAFVAGLLALAVSAIETRRARRGRLTVVKPDPRPR